MPRYIVVASPSYGGAEKRFFDIYTGLRRRNRDVFYIAPTSLIDRLTSDYAERRDVFDGLVTVPLSRWSALTFILEYARVLRTLPRKSAFHYPMNCLWPLHLGRDDTVSMSYVDCKEVPRLLTTTRTTAMSRIAFRFAKRIDVLNPGIYEHVRASRFGRKATPTPGGTFLLPPAKVDFAKEPVAAFLGRLIEDKGIRDLLRIAPQVWKDLRDRVPPSFRMLIVGYGPLEREVAEATARLQEQGVPITFVGYASAYEIMQRAGVILSLQQLTNYPSRVVAEGLASGCGVIVRDSGDSRQFGTLPGLLYCADPLDGTELAGAIATLIDDVRAGGVSVSEKISAAALQRFSSVEYLDYFDGMISV